MLSPELQASALFRFSQSFIVPLQATRLVSLDVQGACNLTELHSGD